MAARRPHDLPRTPGPLTPSPSWRAPAATLVLVAEPTYLYGYQGARFTWADLVSKHWRVATLDPEYLRRLRALFDAARAEGFDAGIGGGARTRAEQAAAYKKDPGNFTPAGISWHENDAYVDRNGKRWAVAIDGVPAGAARTWMKNNAPRFGLIAVDDDWHLQPIELPRSRRNYRPGTVFLGTWDLPNVPPPVDPTPIPPAPIPNPPTGGSVVNVTVQTIRQGDSGGWVKKCQAILAANMGQDVGAIDGHFGPRTAAGVENVQRFFGLTVDRVVGPQTWTILLGVAP